MQPAHIYVLLVVCYLSKFLQTFALTRTIFSVCNTISYCLWFIIYNKIYRKQLKFPKYILFTWSLSRIIATINDSHFSYQCVSRTYNFGYVRHTSSRCILHFLVVYEQFGALYVRTVSARIGYGEQQCLKFLREVQY